MSEHLTMYDAAYGGFSNPEQAAVRAETYGEDIGQTSWMTAAEWRGFADRLQVRDGTEVLEIGSGSGAPAVYLAETRGCRITGVDVNAHGVENGERFARSKGLGDRARFMVVDGDASLPFVTGSFDAVVSNDVICHMPSRLDALREWHRVLRPGGRLLFSDALVVTGPISNEEIAIRSSIGFYLFVPLGENERLLAAAGFTSLSVEDFTASPAVIARRRHDARERHRERLVEVEGASGFASLQRYLLCASRLAAERRLSRFVYLAQRLGTPT
jgi:SAM-dependent methyltransferase